MQELHEEIRMAAYELYEQRGMAHGYDLNDWLQAEKIVMGKNIIADASKEKKTKNNKPKKKLDRK
jgi:hypothetical protein